MDGVTRHTFFKRLQAWSHMAKRNNKIVKNVGIHLIHA